MQELINKLMAEGLTEKQALKSIEIVKNFAKDKFPLFAGPLKRYLINTRRNRRMIF